MLDFQGSLKRQKVERDQSDLSRKDCLKQGRTHLNVCTGWSSAEGVYIGELGMGS